MKVAIDKGPLTSGHKVRGVGAYTRELIRALEQENRRAGGLVIKAVDFGKADLTKYNLVHYPYFHPYFLTLPQRLPAKSVVTIHDLIPLIYPKHYPPGLKGRLRYLVQKRRVRSVDGIIAPSETSKKDIVRFLGIPQEKIKVIYEAPREIFRRITDHRTRNTVNGKYNLPEHFILYVGDVNYNKNILGLADACKINKIPLVIVGKQAVDEKVDLEHPENQSFSKFLNKYSKDKQIIRLGFIPDKDLVVIYNLASVCCQPSFYEGFGLPVLEAMASGTPVVAGRTQALVEIAQDSALYVDPKDSKDIAKGLEKVLNSNKFTDLLSKRGLNRVKKFSWEKAAKETIDYYKHVAKNG